MNSKFNSEEFKKHINIFQSRLSTLINTLYPGANFQFYVRAHENKKLFKYLNNNDVVITQDRDMACIVAYLVNSEGMSFDDAYNQVFLSENTLNVLLFMCNSEIDREGCYDCDGNGENECQECDGESTITCHECNGEGEVDDEEECFECGGDGSVDCSYCDWGRIECSTCEGSGNGDYNVEFKFEQYISLDPRIKELPASESTLYEITKYCEDNNIDLAYYRTNDHTVRLDRYQGFEYDSDVEYEINKLGLTFNHEGEDYMELQQITPWLYEQEQIVRYIENRF